MVDDKIDRNQWIDLFRVGAELHRRAARAADEDDGGEDEVAGPGVVDLLLDEHPDSGGGNDAEEEDADAAHDGRRDAPDGGCELADEGNDDGEGKI